MATIEPRLIHLLNDASTPELSNNDLPPLHVLQFAHSPDRSLPPLEHDTSGWADRSAADGATTPTGRYAGNTQAYPLRLLLGETDGPQSSLSLGKGHDDAADSMSDAAQKKRSRNIGVKDDFVQLPQPVKKQKATQQAPVMPPIINGLLEPPPHAALFPPIASHTFDDNEAAGQAIALHDFSRYSEERGSQHSSSDADKLGMKTRKRATKPRRKWSEDETNHLLLGVHRHGVGKWTSILEDPDFKFNNRTAGDLKDRFRTCCPEELRRSSKSSQPGSPPPQPKHKARKGLHFENILIDDDDLSPRECTTGEPVKQKKSRAHRKKMEDLAELGIRGPFKKSHRRERCPFTEQDDKEILEGLDTYGPAWTKIQRDKRFHLSSRQPTDLRDRVRNKYPEIYHCIEKGTFQPKNVTRETPVNASINHAFKLHKGSGKKYRTNNGNPGEDLPRWPLQMMEGVDYHQTSQSFEFHEPSAPHAMGGEMDISRLLLDDSRPVGRNPSDQRSGSVSPPIASSGSRRYHNVNYSVIC